MPCKQIKVIERGENMETNHCFLSAFIQRRTRYALTAHSPVPDEEIIRTVQTAVKYAPSAFNSQGTRVLVLLGGRHGEFWHLVREELHRVVPADKFKPTEDKIASFAAAYGTILFFEDWHTVQELQQKFPAYKDNFPLWAYQSNAMVELTVWTAFSTLGLGASLQHYNPLVDEAVQKALGVPAGWKLIAQMPFGTPSAPAEEKSFLPLEPRVKVLDK